MLISEIDNFFISDLIRIVGEIQLDRMGFTKESRELHNDKYTFTKDGFTELKAFLVDNNIENTDRIIDGVKRYLLTNYNNVYRDYISLDKISNLLKNSIDTNNSVFDFNKILIEFIQYFEKSCMHNYYFDDSLQGYIYNAFTMFKNGNSKFIYSVINERGLLVDTGDDTIGLEEQLEVSFGETRYDSDFDFQDCISRIHIASQLMFSGDKKTGSNVWGDIVDVYKIYTSEGKVPALEDNIQNVFYPKKHKVKAGKILFENEYFPYTVIPTPVDTDARDYRINTFRTRKSMLSFAYKYIDTHLSADEVYDIYSEFITKHMSLGNTKNESRLFRDSSSLASDRQNMDLFMKILSGVSAISDLKSYCRTIGISIFDIPSDIFRDSKYYKRFTKLEDCLKYYKYTSELINNESEVCAGTMSNDSVYEHLREKNNYNFLSVKHLIDGVLNPKNKITDEVKLTNLGAKLNDRKAKYNTAYNTLLNTGFYNYLTGEGINDYYELIKSRNREGIASKINEAKTLFSYFRRDGSGIEIPFDYNKNNQVLFEFIKLARYFDIYNLLLSRIIENMSILNLSDFEILHYLSSEDLRPIPAYIEDDKSITLLCSSKVKHTHYGLKSIVTYEDITEYNELYQMCYGIFKEAIEFINGKIEDKIKNFAKNNISIRSTVVDINLQSVCILIYNYPDNCTKNLNNFKSMCNITEEGILMKDGKIYRTEAGFYVHEKGYLIHPTNYRPMKIESDTVFK